LTIILGFVLLSLTPTASNSLKITALCSSYFPASSTIKIKSELLATAITCLPLPFPSDAPSIIPGRSNN